jgi:drug/metabolite transporter (DMT)-like permease
VLASLSPAVLAVDARIFVHERLSPAQIAAAGVVLVGVVCLAAG